jgi:hypothetical protein
MRKTKGIVGILSDSSGSVICSVSDFDIDGYNGYTLLEAQKYRVEVALADAAIRAFCSDFMADVIDTYRRQEIVNSLIRKKGFTRTFVAIGYDDEASS